MTDVKWVKLKVGMFDGNSFKRIKKAKIGGESFRDKLTAVWFELLDFAGKCNHSGAFIDSHEIPFADLDDIATMIDREPEELRLCMTFYVKEGMVEIIDDVYQLSNWVQYQNEDGLAKIREKKRIAQAKWRAKKKGLPAGCPEELEEDGEDVENVEQCVDSTNDLPSYSLSYISNSTSLEKIEGSGEEEKQIEVIPPPPPPKPERHKHGQYGWVLLTDAEYDRMVKEYGQERVSFAITYVDESAQSTGNKNRWKDWNLTVRRAIRDGWGRRDMPPPYQGRWNNTGFQTSNPFMEMREERRGHG